MFQLTVVNYQCPLYNQTIQFCFIRTVYDVIKDYSVLFNELGYTDVLFIIKKLNYYV